MRSRIRLAALLALGAGLVPPLAGCGSLAYDRQWSRFEAPADAGPLTGRWKGSWSSQWNGHEGGLRALIEPDPEGGFLARFHSTYWHVLSFRHECVLQVTAREAGVLEFEGQEDLGTSFGGVYRYRGTVQGDRFEARYTADNGDHGVFQMERVPAEPTG